MLCRHYEPQPPFLREIRKGQLNDFVFYETSILSVIQFLKDAKFFSDITTHPEALLGLRRFTRAHQKD